MGHTGTGRVTFLENIYAIRGRAVYVRQRDWGDRLAIMIAEFQRENKHSRLKLHLAIAALWPQRARVLRTFHVKHGRL